MKYLLDSNSANYYMNHLFGVHQRAQDEVRLGHSIGIGIPVLAELISGIERSHSREKNLRILETAMKYFKIWPFDVTAAYHYGRIYADLERMGRPIGSIDVMIASIALSLSHCILVTTDSDFQIIPNLRIVNWKP